MPEENELAQIRRRKMEELMKRQRDAMAPKRHVVIEVFMERMPFVGAPPSIEALRQAVKL